jgi:DNA gyrase subunit A
MTLSEQRVAELAACEQFILVISKKGMGKRTSAYEYRRTNRGSNGQLAMQITGKTGGLAAMFPVDSTDQLMLVTDRGRLIRTDVANIRITGRRAQGVIVFRVDADEQVVSVSRVENVGSDDEQDIVVDAVDLDTADAAGAEEVTSDASKDTSEIRD